MNLEIKELITKQDSVEKLSNITRDEIRDTALDFVASDIPPLKRALIVFILKKLIEDIERMDGKLYERYLEDYYKQNKNSTTPPSLGDFQVICRHITKRVYLDNEKAKKIQMEIERLKEELDKLEYYEDTIKLKYFIKHKGEK